MLVLNEAQTRQSLPWPDLIDALHSMFASDCVIPMRHHHSIDVPDHASATLLLMPAWLPGHYMGVKTVSVFPDNGHHALPAVFGTYLLCSGLTGQPLAIFDGGELTARRTAAVSVLAARFLAHPLSRNILVCGTGRLCLNLIQAYATHYRQAEFRIWGRNLAHAQTAASEARALGFDVQATADLEQAARSANIISCATLSKEPLIRGEWLKPGTHLDLIGGFTPDMREADDEAIRRASVFVDTRLGAMQEAGDIAEPLKSGLLSQNDIQAELSELCRETHKGRQEETEITLFKSVGAALEDLAAAILGYDTILKDRSRS